MRIGINASFLRKIDTGIGQVTRGFVQELVKNRARENEYFLYLEEDISEKNDFLRNLKGRSLKKRVFLPPLWQRDDLARKIWWEKFLLPRYVKKDRCDVFISLYQCPTVLSQNIHHKMLVHDLIPKVFPKYLDNWRKKLYFFLSNQAIRRADEIFTVSEWSKRDIRKYLGIAAEKIKVAYPSIGDEFFEKNVSHEKDNTVLEKYGIFGRYIFYVGGFDFRKNIVGLLRAYRRMIEKYEINDVKLVLGGEDKSAYSPLFTNVKREIEKLGLEDKVKLTGFIEQKDLPALYRQCELFVLPTLYEGFGLMALEAMNAGAPAAVSKTSSLLEVGGDAVLYFDPYDEEEMGRVMKKILQNSKLKYHLSEKGKERAKKFSWQKFVETILG